MCHLHSRVGSQEPLIFRLRRLRSAQAKLFSLDHKLYASDYDSDTDSDSVASENQPLQNIFSKGPGCSKAD